MKKKYCHSCNIPFVGLLFITAFIITTCAQGTSDATPNILREIIVSYASQTMKLQLFRVNEDGSGLRMITNSTKDCIMPAWSPDGLKLVFVQDGDTGLELWLSDPNGMNSRKLIAGGLNRLPTWLPDSKHIVWMVSEQGSSTPEEKSRLRIMNTETLESRELFTDSEQLKFSNSMPAISPDGTKVAFVSDRSGSYRIWVSNLDGTDAKLISPVNAAVDPTLQLPIEQKVPCWSPNGKEIAHWEGVEMKYLGAFTGKPNPERDMNIARTWNVWIVGSDGKDKRKSGRGDDPTWSPDGFVTRSFPDSITGGVKVMIEAKNGWKELPIIPAQTTRFGRFTWKP